MNTGMDRRVRRLERGTSLGLPWGKPPREWTDEQLLAVIGEGPLVNDLLLLQMSTPDALIFGALEKTVEEWVKAYAPGGEQ